MKFLCDNCKAKYQIGDDKVAGKTVRMKCRRCGHLITISASVTESSVARRMAAEPTVQAAQATAIPAPAPSAEPIPLVPRGAPLRPAGPVEPDNDDERTVVMASPPKNPLGTRPGVPPAPRPAAGMPAAPRPVGAPLPAPRPSAPGAPAARPIAPAPAATGAEGISRAFQRAVTDPHPPPAAPSPRTASEDWYVGIGGVPLGPIRLNVIREKAGQGVVDGDSLVWREGFDEWQPLKNFPELLELVHEASSQRQSGVPARRASGAFSPLPPRHAPGTGEAPGHGHPQGPLAALAAQVRSSSAPAEPGALGPGRSTPVPAAATSPLEVPAARPSSDSHAAKPPFDALRPAGAALNGSGAALDVMTDPFAAPRPAPTPSPQNGAALAALAAAAAPMAPAAAPMPVPVAAPSPSIADLVPPRRGLHPMAYAFIAMAAVFGGVAAYVLLVKPPPPPQIVVVQQAAPPPTGTATGDTTTAAPNGTVELDVGGAPIANRGPVGGPRGPDPKASGTPGTPAPPIDTSGFSPGGVAGPSATGPDAKGGSAGGQLSQGEIQGVVSQNQPLVRRKCWQPALDARAKDGPSTAKVSATITIGPSGNVDSVNASGGEKDFPGLSSCVAGKIKGWKFPPSGGSTTVSVPFVFAAQ